MRSLMSKILLQARDQHLQDLDRVFRGLSVVLDLEPKFPRFPLHTEGTKVSFITLLAKHIDFSSQGTSSFLSSPVSL